MKGWEDLGIRRCEKLTTFTLESLGLWSRAPDMDSEYLIINSLLPQLPPGLRRFRWQCPAPFQVPVSGVVRYLKDYPWSLLAQRLVAAAPKVDILRIRVNRYAYDTEELWTRSEGLEARVRKELEVGGYRGAFFLILAPPVW